MERAMAALAKFRYCASGEPVAPEGHPQDRRKRPLEINSADQQATVFADLLADLRELEQLQERVKATELLLCTSAHLERKGLGQPKTIPRASVISYPPGSSVRG